MTAAWWSGADQAELELLWREFVDAVFSHDRRCTVCAAQLRGERPDRCAEFGEVVMALVEWRELRSTASFAAGMRRMQNNIDDLEGGGRR